MPRVLVVGESWFTYTVHQKGFDAFHTSEYTEGGGVFLDALRSRGHEVTYVPSHEIPTRVPATADGFDAYDVVVISDVGANSFQLPPETFNRSAPAPDRSELVRDFVERGGGVLMIGGYLTFSGIDARARWGRTPLAAALPVTMLDRDDRVELPAGAVPEVVGEHAVVGRTRAGPGPRCSASTRSPYGRTPRCSPSAPGIRCWSSAATARADRRRSPPTWPRTGRRRRSWSGTATRAVGPAGALARGGGAVTAAGGGAPVTAPYRHTPHRRRPGRLRPARADAGRPASGPADRRDVPRRRPAGHRRARHPRLHRYPSGRTDVRSRLRHGHPVDVDLRDGAVPALRRPPDRPGRHGGCASRPRSPYGTWSIASAAHTDSSVSRLLVDGVTLSLAPSYRLLRAAADAAGREASDGAAVHIGPVFSSDHFYLDRPAVFDALERRGTLAVEMEAAGLYAVAAAEGGEALAVLTVSDHRPHR